MTSKLKTLIIAIAVLYGAKTVYDKVSAPPLVENDAIALDESPVQESAALPEMQKDSGPKDDLSGTDRAKLAGLMPKDFKRFVLHDAPKPVPTKTFLDAEGTAIDLGAFNGGVTLVNFWATWCAPCLAELPGMEETQRELADAGLTIVPISLDRGGLRKAGGFWKKTGFKAMGLYADPDKDLARAMGVRGLPVSVILGPDGRELGRLVGAAHWDSPEAKAMLHFLIDATNVTGANDQREASLKVPHHGG